MLMIPPPSVTNCHTFSDPLKRDVLYGRPQGGKEIFSTWNLAFQGVEEVIFSIWNLAFPVGKKRFYIQTVAFLLPTGRLRNCADVSYTKKFLSPCNGYDEDLCFIPPHGMDAPAPGQFNAHCTKKAGYAQAIVQYHAWNIWIGTFLNSAGLTPERARCCILERCGTSCPITGHQIKRASNIMRSLMGDNPVYF